MPVERDDGKGEDRGEAKHGGEETVNLTEDMTHDPLVITESHQREGTINDGCKQVTPCQVEHKSTINSSK